MNIAQSVKKIFYKAMNSAIISVTGISLNDMRLGAFLASNISTSGEIVTPEKSLQLDAVFACVKLISETIASMPLKLYFRQNETTSSVARDHPLFNILYNQPNADMTGIEFWGVMMTSLLLWGNAYAQIMRRDDGTIIALNPLRPDHIQIERDFNNGTLIYNYAYLGQTFQLHEEDIIHIKGFSFDGLIGLSPISIGANSLGNVLSAEKVAAKTFQNGIFSSSYIKANDYLTEDQASRAKAVLSQFTSAVNAGKMPFLQGGWTIENIGLKPEDSQLLETRSFGIETVCRWFGVQPVMIGRMEKSTAWGSGLEQMNLWFLQYCLQPWLVRIEQAISRCLLSPTDRTKYFARHNVDALLRGDSQSRAQYYVAGRQNGYLTANEIREKENLPPLEGGDILTVQAQMVALEKLGTSNPLDATSIDNGAL